MNFMANFVHLHTHSEFSLLDGLGKIDHLIDRAKSFGMDAIVITEDGRCVRVLIALY